uniref:Uncharacterized protein n=1 Tax=Oryzias latipes TaxID=8090 RepID=A0A3P9K0L9_ORYLA
MILIPLPLQATHFSNASKVPTYPLQALHNTFLLSCSFVVFPLYKSSRDTLWDKTVFMNKFLCLNQHVKHVVHCAYFRGCIISSPLLFPPLRPLPCPPMNPKSPPPKM